MTVVLDDFKLAPSELVSEARLSDLTTSPRYTQQPLSERLWAWCQRGLALLAMLALLPLFMCLFVAVKLTSPGPFLYRQQRFGKYGIPFDTLKIRTMTVGADRDRAREICVTACDPTITRIGRLLRDLKLDELPQLWNVVRGDMKLVGPRPIAPALQEALEAEIPNFADRLLVKPGLTSLAQICIIRNREGDGVIKDWQMRFEAEMHYIANRSFSYDVIIIALTAIYLVQRFFSETLINRLGRFLRVSATAACCLILAGCGYGGTVEADGPLTRLTVSQNGPVQQASLTPGDLVEREKVSVPALNAEPPEPGYRVGPGDTLAINVFDEPGLNELLLRVDADGNIQIPILETFPVAGKTEVEIRDALKQEFSTRFNNPWVIAQVADYRSQPVYLLGEFNSAGVKYLNGPTNVVQAIGYANGLKDTAYLKAAQVRRDGEVLAIDMQAILREGAADQNIWLKPGDTIFVPNIAEREAYILGAVQRPGAVSLATKSMTLLQAITEAGGPLTPAAQMSDVRIIRANSPLEGELLVVDVNQILSGRMLDVPLQSDDIVFIPQNAIGDWNDVVAAVSPSLELVGATLQPFVQIRFLVDDN